MGKQKYQNYVKELIEKSPVVDMGSIKRIIRHKKNIKQYHKQLVRNLLLKGKIKKITKGYYSIYEDPSLIVFCFKPSYLGLQDALSAHNLWEQEAIPVVVTVVSENTALIANVGDSRAYLIGEEIKRITRDHSLVQELLIKN